MKSLFILGCPRSGTTYLLRLLAANQNFAWISNELNLDPENYELSKGLQEYNSALFGPKRYLKFRKRNKQLQSPVEPWGFWNAHFDYFQWNKAFSVKPTNALPDNNSADAISKTRNAVKAILNHSDRDFFLSKYTDFPRLKLIQQTFPEAKFIHIVRDGRAVANSYFKKIESGDFNTSKEESNWVSAWPEEWQNKYRAIENKPLAFTLFQWKFFINEIQNEMQDIDPNNIIEIKYSDLVSDTEGLVQQILNFASVPMDKCQKFFIQNIPGNNMNYKWKERLTDEEIALYDEIVHEEHLRKYLD